MIVPQYGDNAANTGAGLMQALLNRAASTEGNNASSRNAMLEAQTADLERRGRGSVAMIENIDKLASVYGALPGFAALQGGYDPARGLGMGQAAVDATSTYASEADQLRLLGDYASAAKDLGAAAEDFTDGAGLQPNPYMMFARQTPDFTRVARASELDVAAAAAMKPDTVRKQLYTSYVNGQPITDVAGNPIATESLSDWIQLGTGAGLGALQVKIGDEVMTLADASRRFPDKVQPGVFNGFRTGQTAPIGETRPQPQFAVPSNPAAPTTFQPVPSFNAPQTPAPSLDDIHGSIFGR